MTANPAKDSVVWYTGNMYRDIAVIAQIQILGLANCKIIPARKPASFPPPGFKSAALFQTFHARYSIQAAPNIFMIISILGRNTSGVKVMNVGENVEVASIAKVREEKLEDEMEKNTTEE